MQFWWVPFLLQLDGMPKVTVHFWPPSATKTGELRFVHRHFSIEGKKTLFGPKAHLVRHSESGCKRGVCWKSLHLRKAWRFERRGCGDWFGWMAWEIGEIVRQGFGDTSYMPPQPLLYQTLLCIWLFPILYWTLYQTTKSTNIFVCCTKLFAVPIFLLHWTKLATVPNSLLYQTLSCNQICAVPNFTLFQTLYYATQLYIKMTHSNIVAHLPYMVSLFSVLDQTHHVAPIITVIINLNNINTQQSPESSFHPMMSIQVGLLKYSQEHYFYECCMLLTRVADSVW